MASYVPSQGDLVVISFDPQAGHEQKGRRPGIVVSVDCFNRGTGLAMCCPITNTKRSTSFHLPIPDESGLTGYVMCEQIKSLDYRARGMNKIGGVPRDFLNEVLSIIDACIFPRPEQNAVGKRSTRP